MSFRRYEILLPIRFNDGLPVGEELFTATRKELVAEFGAVTWSPDRFHGIWSHEGKIFEDDHIKVIVDVEDTAAVRQFFRRFKEVLKARFQQIDVWIVSSEIEIH